MKILSFFILLYYLCLVNCETQLVSCPKSSSGVFNLCFYNDGELIKTTSGNPYGHGYGVVLKVDSNEHEIFSTSKTVDDIKIVTLLINISDQVGIRHIVSNTGNVAKTISVGVHADIQIYNTDEVPIYRVEPMRGFKFSDTKYELYLLFLQKYENHPAIDSIWYGLWDERFDNLWVNASSSSFTNDDSAIAYSWQNYRLLPNEKINFTAAFTTNPNFNFSIIPDYIPTEKFTPSNTFSDSQTFTNSDIFSDSHKFSKSLDFTKSFIFTESNIFSNTQFFSLSKAFSKSLDFTASNLIYKIFSSSDNFSNSEQFSCSQSFSKSDDFSISKLFTNSRLFSISNDFSKSQIFLSSKQFSCSQSFSKSYDFSRSKLFTNSIFFSNSNDFTKSQKFTMNENFQLSKLFSISENLSQSQYNTINEDLSLDEINTNSQILESNEGNSNSEQFSCSQSNYDFQESNDFTKIQLFSFSYDFSKSDIAFSQKFTNTNEVTFYYDESNIFSKSLFFIFSDEFNDDQESTLFISNDEISFGNTFSNSNMYTSTYNQIFLSNDVTYSIFQSLTYTRVRSVSFSISFSLSHSYYMSYDENKMSYFYTITQSDNIYYLPYIIFYYSQSYTMSYICFPIRKKTISKEKLIGIISVSFSVFFFILFIIIKFLTYDPQKGLRKEYGYLNYFINNENIITTEINDNTDTSNNIDLNFWLFN